MTFVKKVAEICYTQLNLLLLAIEARKFEGGEIYINPKEKIINPNAIGLFMTDSADSAKRAWFYCRKCHANIKSEKQVGRDIFNFWRRARFGELDFQVSKCDCKRTAVRNLERVKAGTKRRKNNNIVDQVPFPIFFKKRSFVTLLCPPSDRRSPFQLTQCRCCSLSYFSAPPPFLNFL